ncbi:DNA polymerase III subunit beta family protein [Rhodococcus spongiicola]|uniref:MerR family transcriptional regulator n=1 Tax=Rhodococcus spongiicola TaxID=2487352 RepID=A0A3S3B4U8_9NOCA|nr:MerR family transcriptional regulator [Rhodococcus spongiicola]RVW03234.1 MerR family transcriptional regulator [Rhodococcus spongiicola]
MSRSELMSIGSFARRSGITASALRFYADSGLLLPAKVDPISGYRFYSDDQLERAVLLRRLRAIGMPLASAESVLCAEQDEAVRAVEAYVDAVVGEAATARQQAAVIRASLAPQPALLVVTVSGPVLTAAIEQVLTAAAYDRDIAVLNGVRFEVDSGAATLTATDRYRLSTRTLVPAESSAMTWAATVNADDLRSCLPDLRRSPLARIEATEYEIWIRLADRDDHHCRLLTEPFPDYRLMLAALPPITTRVEVPKALLLASLEERSADHISLRVGQAAVAVGGRRGERDHSVRLPARVTGPSMEVWFELTTLYPAVSTAIGADVLLDLRAPDQPATIRSADNGDLTTLAMPTNPQSRETNAEPANTEQTERDE